MVTKTITPALESDNSVSEYAGYDFGQVNLDIIQFEQSMFETYLKHDFGSLQALDESSLQIIEEGTFKEALTKVISFIDSIVDKIRAAIRKAITNIQARFNVYGKFAKKMREQINSSVSWEDKPGETVEGRSFLLKSGPSTIVNLISLKFADDVVKKVTNYADSGDINDLHPIDTDFEKHYIDSKNANSVYDAMKDDISKAGKFACKKSIALDLLDGVDQANMIIKLYKSAESNIQSQFASIKKSLKGSVKDARSEKDTDQLQMLANVQKIVSKYAAMANRMMSAGYSAIGYGISGNMKLVQAIASKCMGKVQKANKLNSQELPPDEKPLNSDGAIDGDYKEVKESTFDDFDIFGMILEGEFGDNSEFIAPGNPPVDETESQIEPEKDNYENDPEDDNAMTDPIDNEDLSNTVPMSAASLESFEDDDFNSDSMILGEGEFGDNGEFIELGKPPVDETESQIEPEKDNYENDPEDDDARPDLMNDTNGVETVTSESFFDDFNFDMMMLEGEFGDNGEFIEPGNPPVDETEVQHDPEKDNYENDPEDDDARPDLMNDTNGVETVTSESNIDSFFNDDDIL